MRKKAWRLPEDILVEEILPKMHVKSLLTFKCVSRFFRTIISRPEFIHRYLRRSLSLDSNCLLVLVGRKGDLYTVDLDSPELPAVSFRTRSINEGRLFVVGSCHGLVCVGSPLSFFIVFNPSTGMYTQFNCEVAVRTHFNYGFGFDDVNDDYKIVRVTDYYYWFDHSLYDYSSRRREVRVYSLKSGSSTLVDRTSYVDKMKNMDNGAVIDNHLVHWMFYHPQHHEHRIGCFNLRHDRWGDDVPLPDYDLEAGNNGVQTERDKQKDLVHLGVLDGCLCLLTQSLEGLGVDVWVMKEYGVKDSWVKLASISFGEHAGVYPLAYAQGSRSEILFCVNYPRSKFFWCNITDETERWAEFHGLPSYFDSCICKPSLFQIANGVHFQIEHPRNEDKKTAA